MGEIYRAEDGDGGQLIIDDYADSMMLVCSHHAASGGVVVRLSREQAVQACERIIRSLGPEQAVQACENIMRSFGGDLLPTGSHMAASAELDASLKRLGATVADGLDALIKRTSWGKGRK